MLRHLGIVGLSVSALVAMVAGAACGSSGNSSSGGGDGGGENASSSGTSSGASSNGGASSGGSSSGTTSSGSSSGTGSSSGSSGGSSSGVDAGPDYSVYQHHRNGTRDGLFIDPNFKQSTASTTHVLTSFLGTVSTTVYAQPLYVQNGPGGNEAFLVATEDNHVTTYDGTGKVVWDVGPTVIGQYATKNPPGGSVGPSHIGITGTPYIDIGSRTVFFDAMTTPDNNTTYQHKVFALDLDTGAVVKNWPVTVDTVLAVTDGGATFDSGVQNQRGALQFVNGVLYVPYGGYDGDGGNYYGAVVGFPVSSPQTPMWWHTTAFKGGVWGPGALPTDGTSVFPVTGNTTQANNVWGGGEAVIRLTAGPTFSGATADYFAPTNWQDLDNSDTDLGGASEVLLDMPGAQYPHLVVAGGKDGNLYVMNRDNLGGIGGQLYMTSVSGNQIKGAPAAYTTAQGTYIALHIEGGTGTHCPTGQGGNMVVLKITQSPLAATVMWCSTEGDLASPMVTTTDGTSEPIVWNADNKLYGWNGDTGAVIVTGANTAMSTAVQKWNTPIAANGRIVVGVNGQLYVFTQ